MDELSVYYEVQISEDRPRDPLEPNGGDVLPTSKRVRGAYSGRFYHKVAETYPHSFSDREAIEVYTRGVRPYCRLAPPIPRFRSFGEMRWYFEDYVAYMHLGDVLAPVPNQVVPQPTPSVMMQMMW